MTADHATETAYNRIQSLIGYDILDTGTRSRLHRMTQIICTLLDVPFAVFSFFDGKSQSFRSHLGYNDEERKAYPIPEFEICRIDQDHSQPLIIEDASEHELYGDHPLVNSAPHLRFYASFPLITSDGALLGKLCAMDYKARDLSETEQAAILGLLEILTNEIELHHVNNQLVSRNWELEEEVDMLQHQNRELYDQLQMKARIA